MPNKVSGVPILRHSRVPADAVLESNKLGESVEEIAYSYSLDERPICNDFGEIKVICVAVPMEYQK